MRTRYFAFLFAALLSGCDTLSEDPDTGQVIARDTSTGFTINPSTGWPDAGSTWSNGASTVTGTGAWNVALSLPVGSSVPPIAANVVDSSTSAVAMMLVSYAGSGSSFTVLGQANSTSSGAQTVSLSSSHVVTSTESLVLRFTTPGATTAATVGTIGVGAAPRPAPTVTRIIPVTGATVTPPLIYSAATISGVGSGAQVLTVPLGGDVGATLVAIRARVTDVSGSPVRLQLAVSGDNAESMRVIGGPVMSSGTGTEQTVTLSTAAAEIDGQQHFILLDATSASPDTVWGLRADYQ